MPWASAMDAAPVARNSAAILVKNNFFILTLWHSGSDQQFVVNDLQLPRSGKVIFIFLRIKTAYRFLAVSRHKIAFLGSFYFVENIFVAVVYRQVFRKTVLANGNAIKKIWAMFCINKTRMIKNFSNFAMDRCFAPSSKHCVR